MDGGSQQECISLSLAIAELPANLESLLCALHRPCATPTGLKLDINLGTQLQSGNETRLILHLSEVCNSSCGPSGSFLGPSQALVCFSHSHLARRLRQLAAGARRAVQHRLSHLQSSITIISRNMHLCNESPCLYALYLYIAIRGRFVQFVGCLRLSQCRGKVRSNDIQLRIGYAISRRSELCCCRWPTSASRLSCFLLALRCLLRKHPGEGAGCATTGSSSCSKVREACSGCRSRLLSILLLCFRCWRSCCCPRLRLRSSSELASEQRCMQPCSSYGWISPSLWHGSAARGAAATAAAGGSCLHWLHFFFV
mmetsp:Transcript_13762/g.32337  ORF Transcript_13762/g.32337 Transcript_13762/m.32337 type:complete len:312 (+) Transcript_13762:2272-3207(+)